MNTAKLIRTHVSTSIAFAAIVECQRSKGIAAFIDTDHTVDLVAAAAAGVNVGNLLVSQPDNVNQTSEICETLARSGAIDLLVVTWKGEAPFMEAALVTGTTVICLPSGKL